MSPNFEAYSGWVGSFPRVSGDEPLIYRYRQTKQPFSPRERG